jgi:hypothetical protein
MNPINLLRFFRRTPVRTEEPLLRRLDGIQGHRQDKAAPALTAFTPRPRQAVAR